ncbi:hypothetical protein GCM10008023_05710 [Sphingomonas glacialis]|uniref:XRE family transcriptional regulator n=1 Tax=Sphingomonas glacialis TaxID=658225 RepID=A0ABQ3LIH0_9SPHN|nr:hypothetical protein [Sphingomonas glacialis]GHH09264.1 hypothetical protein GCM10008023_05710 [Sphingomonas glacialis]
MTRAEIMAWAVTIYGSRQRVGDAIGVTRTTVLRIERGELPLLDRHATTLLNALIEHAGAADKLADALAAEIDNRPVRGGNAAARAAFGCEA